MSVRPGFDGRCVRIADITIGLISADPELELRVEGTMEKFLVDDVAEPEVIVRTSWANLSDEDPGVLRFDSGSIWKLFSDNNEFVFRIAAPFSNWLPYKLARFNSSFTDGEIRCQREFFPPGPVYPLEYPLDELLINNLLANGRGVEVHACGLIDDSGDGYLFVGHSQAGKTTTARLWEKQPGIRILSDDRIIIRKLDGRFWMYGTPWHGEAPLSDAARTQLKHIFFLKQSPQNEIAPVGIIAAAARFFACGFPPFHSASGVDFTLGFFEDLVRAVPVMELRFLPDQRAVDLVRERCS